MQIIKTTINENENFYSANFYFATEEEAKELQSKFPKYLGAVVSKWSDGLTGGNGGFLVVFEIWLSANLANGGVNETGLKKIASFKKSLEKLGLAA
jgi:hypothetical protein